MSPVEYAATPPLGRRLLRFSAGSGRANAVNGFIAPCHFDHGGGLDFGEVAVSSTGIDRILFFIAIVKFVVFPMDGLMAGDTLR